ncbi:hypothetical protein JOM56_012671 [Amanita muscaria]
MTTMPPKRMTLRLRGPSTLPPVASTSSVPLQTAEAQGDSPRTSPTSNGHRSATSPALAGNVATLSAALELESPPRDTTSPVASQQSPLTSTLNTVRAGSILGLQVRPLRQYGRKGKERALQHSLAQTQCSPIAEQGDDVAVTHTLTLTPTGRQHPPRTPVVTRTHSTARVSRTSMVQQEFSAQVTPPRGASLLEHGTIPRRASVTDGDMIPGNSRKRSRAGEDAGAAISADRRGDQPFSREDLRDMLSEFRSDILARCREMYQPPAFVLWYPFSGGDLYAPATYLSSPAHMDHALFAR